MSETLAEKIVILMRDPKHIRNIATCAHIDHGKTTFSDSLLAGAGMMSEELAGKQLALDFHEDEIARGITIDAANVSMVHHIGGSDFLINLIDTPGHVDFGGDVTRAMRAVDGAIVLVDSVEGMMPQTETVLRQALKERVKPVLFINKVDRLIREVKLTPEKMQEKFFKIIMNVNQFIASIAPDEFKQKWQVNAADGSVAFGSAFHKWALSVPYMKSSGVSFKDVYEAYEKDNYKELAKKAPLHKVVLDMVAQHHPNPVQAQAYRIPRIWHGEAESELGQSLLHCDPNGPVAFVVTKIVIDKHAGEIAAGRLFSGTIRQGMDVYLNGAKKTVRIQQVSVYKGAQRLAIEEAVAGNIVGLVGLRDTFAGETVSSEPMEPFEAIKHLFEPVVTISIEAKKPSDLPRLVEVLRQTSKEDPTIKISINEETGENLMSGMGELHLEVRINRIKTEKGLDVQTSEPIVVYRESIQKVSAEMEGKSPNKHNKFYIIVEPIPEDIYQSMKAGEIPEVRLKKKDQMIVDTLRKFGMDAKSAIGYVQFYKGCVLVNEVKGEVHIGEVLEMIMDGFEEVMNEGPLAREPGIKMKVRLLDMKLHEDAIHRGPAQILPAVRESITGAMRQANATLLEPLQIHLIEVPDKFMGEMTKLVGSKRGQLLEVKQENGIAEIDAKLPVAEMIGWSNDLRSGTEGRGVSSLKDQLFEKIPMSLQEEVIRKIRQRKGLSENQ